MTTVSPERSRVHRITGIVVGVLLGVLALGFAFSIYATFFSFLNPTTGLPASCSAAQVDGTHCSPSFLTTIVIVGYAVCLFGWGLPAGVMVIRLIQKRRAWFWPLISLPIVYLGYFILVYVLGSAYLPASGS